LLTKDNDSFGMMGSEVMADISASAIPAMFMNGLQRLSIGSNDDAELFFILSTLVGQGNDIRRE
jgi:hypothetical protein